MIVQFVCGPHGMVMCREGEGEVYTIAARCGYFCPEWAGHAALADCD